MLLAQISDFHITPRGKKLYDRIDTIGFLRKAVQHLNALQTRPDFTLITGDLVDAGSPPEYEMLRELVSGLAMPYALMPGNHDERGNLRRAFADHAYLPKDGEFIQYTIEDLPLRLIALDSLIPGEGGGRLCQKRLDWLAARLEEQPKRPTLIALHHPPFDTGIEGMDDLNCRNGEALGAIVARHRQVERIVCGHVHRPICMRWYGTLVTTAPGTAHQVALDFRPGRGVAWIMEPPACHLHRWTPETGLVTHVSYMGDHGPATDY
jgi:3',5'-cyclic AMP phosphodiesterase CpdA